MESLRATLSLLYEATGVSDGRHVGDGTLTTWGEVGAMMLMVRCVAEEMETQDDEVADYLRRPRGMFVEQGGAR